MSKTAIRAAMISNLVTTLALKGIAWQETSSVKWYGGQVSDDFMRLKPQTRLRLPRKPKIY